MCGIVGYIGTKDAYPILIKGLKRLEYRGYDSAGVALLNGDTSIYKKKGKVSELEDHVRGKETTSTIGMPRTRIARDMRSPVRSRAYRFRATYALDW